MSEHNKINLVQKKIIKSLLYGTYEVMNIFYARIHTCGKNAEYWLYSGLEGALTLCIDMRVKSCRFLMIDLKTYETVFDCELYKKFDKAFKKGTERFYYFEVENGFIGFEIPSMEQAELLGASIISFGDEYIKRKLKEFKAMKETEIKEKSKKMIGLLEKKLCQDNNQPKMLRAEIILKHGLLEKMINTVELNDETGKIIVKGNGYQGVDNDLLKIKGLNLDLRTDLKVGDAEIFTKYISRNILRSYMKGIIIPKRKINRGEGVIVNRHLDQNNTEDKKSQKFDKRGTLQTPLLPINMQKEIQPEPEPEPKRKKSPSPPPKPPSLQKPQKKEKIKETSPPKQEKESSPPKQVNNKEPSPPKQPIIKEQSPPKQVNNKRPSPPKQQKIKKPSPPKQVNNKKPSPPKQQKIKEPPQPKQQKEEIRQPSPPKNMEIVCNSKGVPPPPPPPPPPIVKTVKSSAPSKPSKPIDLAAELAAKKKNLVKVEIKDLSIPNVQSQNSSSTPQTGNSMMAAIMAQRNAMKRVSAPQAPTSSLPKPSSSQVKKSVEQPQAKKPAEQPQAKKPAQQPPKNIAPSLKTSLKPVPKTKEKPVAPSKPPQKTLNKGNNNPPPKPSTSGAKPPMKIGGGGGFAAMRNMLQNRMAPQPVKKEEGPKKPIVELGSGNVPRMNLSKLMSSLEKNMSKNESTSNEPVKVVSSSGAGVPPPPPPPPPPPKI